MRQRFFQKSVLPLMACLALTGCFKSSEERAAEHFESGLELVAAGDIDRALVEFRNTLRFAENHIEAARQIGKINFDKDLYGPAYRNYLRVVENKPNDLEGRTTLAQIAFATRSWDEFARHAKAAIELAPDDATVRVIDTAARYREAVLAEDFSARNAILVEAEELSETQPDNTMLRQLRIDGYVQQEEFDKALEQIEISIQDTPEDRDLYNGKLELLARLNRPDDIEAELYRIAERFPDDNNIKSTLLRYLISRGKSDEAETFLRDSIAATTDPLIRNARYANLIQFLLSRDGADAALAELEVGLAAEGSPDTLRALRGTINFDSGNRRAGITELQELLSSEDSTLTALERQNVSVALAKMLVSDGNEVGARKLIEDLLEADPNAVGALKMQAEWLTREDDTNGAIAALRTALDSAPQDAEAMTLMAAAYERAGNADLMLNFLTLAVDASNNAPAESLRYAAALRRANKPLQAEATLIDALRITPGNVPVLSALGQIYLEIDDLPRARQVVDTLRRIETPVAQTNADRLNVELLSRESGAEDALKFIEELSQKEGQAGLQAKMSLLRARLQNGEPDAGLAYIEGLVAEEPDNLQYRNALALTHAALRNYERAETEMRGLLEIQPSAGSIWLQLTRVLLAQDKRDEALKAIDDGLAANEGNPDLLWAKASFLQRDNDIDGAIAIYERMYETFSGSPVIANNLASLLSTYRNDEASIARAQVIARRLKDTTVPAFQDTYGWLQHLDGDSATALTYIEPAAAALPNDMQVQLHLGLVYAALARTDEAITQLQKTITEAGPLGRADLIEQARAKITELQSQSSE